MTTTPSGEAVVERIEPTKARVTAETRLRGGSDVAFGDGRLWIAVPTSGKKYFAQLIQLDPKTNRLLPKHIELLRATSIAFGERAVWATGANTVSRVDPDTGRAAVDNVQALEIGVEIEVGAGAAWVADGASDALYRIDN